MRLQVTLLLLLGLFLKEGFCIFPDSKVDVCDIKIKDFNTYEITCPKPKPSEVDDGENERKDQDQGTVITKDSKNLCCRLHVSFGTAQGNIETNTWHSGQSSDCEISTTSTSSTWGKVKRLSKMVTDTSTGGNACKLTIKSEIEDSEGMVHSVMPSN